MSKKYSNLSLKEKFVVQLDRKLKFLMGPLTTYYGLSNIGITGKFAKYYESESINKNRVFYETRAGKSLSDSPYAVFKYLLKNKKYDNLEHVWSVDNNTTLTFYKEKYRKYKNVHFVIRHSDQYLKELARCKYIFNNTSFSQFFATKPQQIYINTWHGTPLKHLGLDLDSGIKGIQNLSKNFLNTRYILSQNKHSTDVFNRSFQLKNLYDGEILEIGYPRTDLTFKENKHIKDMLKQIKLNDNLQCENLLIAPTYRGNFNKPSDDIEKLYQDIKKLEENLEYNVFLKVHPFVYSSIKNDERFKNYLIPDFTDTNELLSHIDLLVTDYSSIFFDYMVTNKPILFYTEDYELYKNERGLYFDVDALPGPTTTDIDELIENIKSKSYLEKEIKNRYIKFKKQLLPFDDGNVSQRLVEKVFESKVNYSKKTNKERILMYAGGMKSNGITSSLLSLLEYVDYSKYEVTIFLQNTNDKVALENIARINKNVNIILRGGAFLATLKESYQNNFVKDRGLVTDLERKLYPKKAYKREFRRIFGNVKFDTVIDFSGYSMFWSNILLATKSTKKLVYLHSDMKKDLNRVVNRRRPHALNLKGLISLYPEYDYLVNVSNNVKQINEEKMSDLNIDEKFVVATNLINSEEIIYKSNLEDNIIKINEDEIRILSNSNNGVNLVPLNKNNFNMFASGRLSPEKGFAELIEAFSTISKNNKHARLYILGNGPERSRLETLIFNRKLEDKVYLLGYQSNPFSLIKYSDLFVLTSRYEGQGLVLLESLTLGVNVLSNDLTVTREVLKNGELGMLYDGTREDLIKSIEKFINNSAPKFKKFDYETYNKLATKQFEKLLN